MTRRRTPWLLRASVGVTLVGVVALSAPGHLSAAPGATITITVNAVGANGEPVNGYQVANRQGSPNLSACLVPSPAAVGNNIYSCEPAQAAAEVCWPAPASVLCLMDPWSKALRRFAAPGSLPAVRSARNADAVRVAARRRHAVHPAQWNQLGRTGGRHGARVRMQPGQDVDWSPDRSWRRSGVGDRQIAAGVGGTSRRTGPT